MGSLRLILMRIAKEAEIAEKTITYEPLAKLKKTSPAAEAGGRKLLKRLDSRLRGNDDSGFLQEALTKRILQRTRKWRTVLPTLSSPLCSVFLVC
jgi:hypothetical protein